MPPAAAGAVAEPAVGVVRDDEAVGVAGDDEAVGVDDVGVSAASAARLAAADNLGRDG